MLLSISNRLCFQCNLFSRIKLYPKHYYVGNGAEEADCIWETREQNLLNCFDTLSTIIEKLFSIYLNVCEFLMLAKQREMHCVYYDSDLLEDKGGSLGITWKLTNAQNFWNLHQKESILSINNSWWNRPLLTAKAFFTHFKWWVSWFMNLISNRLLRNVLTYPKGLWMKAGCSCCTPMVKPKKAFRKKKKY